MASEIYNPNHSTEEELELTDEMIARNDEIDNATYDYVLMLTGKSEDELPWDMAIIGGVVGIVKEFLWHSYKIKVRHPSVATNPDGSWEYSEYEYGKTP